ncbi:g5841 [Coccomyxa elongata]
MSGSPHSSSVSRMSLSLMLLASLFVAGSARDISDVAGILSDFKTAATKIPDAKDFEVAYQQYAELLAPVMLLSNGLNFERADQAIADLFTSIANQLAGIGEVITGKAQPQVSISPFSLLNEGAANISTNLAGAAAAAVGINYAPCLISTSARGFDATAAAVNFQPNVIEILAEGLAVWPQAVNIQPALIYINPWGLNVSPMGVSIAPALIAVAPTITAVGDTAVSVSPVGLTVPPPGK